MKRSAWQHDLSMRSSCQVALDAAPRWRYALTCARANGAHSTRLPNQSSPVPCPSPQLRVVINDVIPHETHSKCRARKRTNRLKHQPTRQRHVACVATRRAWRHIRPHGAGRCGPLSLRQDDLSHISVLRRHVIIISQLTWHWTLGIATAEEGNYCYRAGGTNPWTQDLPHGHRIMVKLLL